AAFGGIPTLPDRLQAYLPLRVDLLHFDSELVPYLDGLLHGGQPLPPTELGYVHQTVPAREDVHEGAEGGGLHHGSLEPLSHLRQPRIDDGFDHVHRPLRALAVPGSDEHAAVVFDVDVGAGQGDDLVDPLALRPDDLTDLVDGDLLHDHSGSLQRQ